MNYQRLIIISVLTVIIFIIAVFLWLNAGFIYNKYFQKFTDTPNSKPTILDNKQSAAENKTILDDGGKITIPANSNDNDINSTDIEDKKSEVIEALVAQQNRQNTTATATIESNKAVEDKKLEILNALETQSDFTATATIESNNAVEDKKLEILNALMQSDKEK